MSLAETLTAKTQSSRTARPTATAPETEPAEAPAPDPIPPAMTAPPAENETYLGAVALRDQLALHLAEAEAALADARARHTEPKHQAVRDRVSGLLAGRPTAYQRLPDLAVLTEDVTVAAEALAAATARCAALRREISLAVVAERKPELDALALASYEAAGKLCACSQAQDEFLSAVQRDGVDIGYFRVIKPMIFGIPFDRNVLRNFHAALAYGDGPLAGTTFIDPTTTDPRPNPND